ncbi:MAG: hypothetical protein RLN83_08135 [Balneola sp.]
MKNFQQEIFPSETREALRKNPSPQEVADNLGLHVSTVYRHAKDMDLKLIKKLKDIGFENELAMLFLNTQGVSNKEISKIFGVSLPYVHQSLRKLLKPEALKRKKGASSEVLDEN